MMHLLWILPLAYVQSCLAALMIADLYARDSRWVERVVNWWLLPLKLVILLVVGPLCERWLDWRER